MRSLIALLLVALVVGLPLVVGPNAEAQKQPAFKTIVGYEVYHVECKTDKDCEKLRDLLATKLYEKGAKVFAHFGRFFDVYVTGTRIRFANGAMTPVSLTADGRAALGAIQRHPGYFDAEFRVDVAPPPPGAPLAGKLSRGDAEAIIRGGAAGYKGRGVIVAVLDTGIDFHNAEFIKEVNGKKVSRLLWYWDTAGTGGQTKTPVQYPNGDNIGRLYSRDELTAEINAATRSFDASIDNDGHGTACASIAAGNGRSWPKPVEYEGVAPEADLVAVRLGPMKSLQNGYLLNAICAWLETLNQPFVVSCSYGNSSPTTGFDGNGIDTRHLSARFEKAKGRAICIAAGNDGYEPIHRHVTIQPGKDETLSWTIPGPLNGQVSLLFDSKDISVVFKGGASVAMYRDFNFHKPSGQVRWNTNYTPGKGTVTLTNVGKTAVTVDLYVQSRSFNPITKQVGGYNSTVDKATFSRMIDSPGGAEHAITVGSIDWNPYKKTHSSVRTSRTTSRGMVVGSVSPYSSPGPSRGKTKDGKEITKPEVVAPGQWFPVHRPKGSLKSDGSGQKWNGEEYGANGTSSATPYVAGVIALMLEAKKDLTAGEIKEWLAKRADPKFLANQLLTHPKAYFGHGYLKASAIDQMLKDLKDGKRP